MMKSFPQYYATNGRDSYYRFSDQNTVIKVASGGDATYNNFGISYAENMPDSYFHGISHTCQQIEEGEFIQRYWSVKVQQEAMETKLFYP